MKLVADFFKNLGIRYKLLASYTLVLTLVTLVGGAVIYHKVRSSIEASIEREKIVVFSCR